MSREGNVAAALERLQDLAVRYAAVRLTATPRGIVLEDAGSIEPLDEPWDPDEHVELRASVEAPERLGDGSVLLPLGDDLVLVRGEVPADMATLVDDGWASDLAGRTLEAAAALGRNVLVAGPWAAARALAGALVGSGRRPAFIGTLEDAPPHTWSTYDAVETAQRAGADRMAIWGPDPHAVVVAMSQATGVVGCLAATRLEQALVRYEASIERRHGDVTAPLQLLGSVDLVVIVEQVRARPRVREIVEVQIADEGYRPQHLFARGLGAAPGALVPVAAPSFVDAIAASGDGVLADELRHATGAMVPIERARPVEPPAAAPVVEPPFSEPAAPSPRRTPRAARRPEPAYRASPDAPAPGWELDQLGEQGSAPDETGVPGAEDAAMAAAFGLGPPPRPAGVTMRPDQAVSFEDAMQRARERDEEMRREEEDEDASDA